MNSLLITIPGFESLSPQRIFDMAAEHVLKNGKPAMNDNASSCTYRGIGCAASVFLKDPQSAPVASWGTLCDEGLAPQHQEHLICEIQLAHDKSAQSYDDHARRTMNPNFVSDFIAKMELVAKNFNLNPGVLFAKLTHNLK
jgi:hypothetical protein